MTDVPEHLLWLHERHGSALSAALVDREGIELLPGAAIAAFARADPTPGLRLTDWLVRTYVEQATYGFEDIEGGTQSTVGTTLALFVERRGTLPPERRNINLYDSPGALWKAVGGDVAPKPSKSEDRDRARAESRVLVDDERGIVAVPLTEYAACWWGRGTRWCTAARENNLFHSYAAKGPLFVLIPPGGKKAQLHLVKGCNLMDAADTPIADDDLAEFQALLDPIVRWTLEVNGNAIRFGSPELRQDRNSVMQAIRNQPSSFLVVRDTFADDDEIAGMAVGESATMLAHVSQRLRDDKILALKAVKGDSQGLALALLSPRMRDDREVVIQAVRASARAVEYASKRLKDNREIAWTAVTGDGSTLKFLGERMKDDREIVLKAMETSGIALCHASIEIRNDRDMALLAVNKSGVVLHEIRNMFGNDKEVVLIAVKQHGEAFFSAGPDLQRDPEVIQAALAQDGHTIRSMHQKLRSDKTCALLAVSSDGYALRHVSMDLRKDPEVVLAAVKQNGLAIEFADKGLRADRSMALAAVTQDGTALMSITRQHWHDRDIVMTAVRQNGFALVYAPSEFRDDKEIVLLAVSQNLTSKDCISHRLRQDPDVMSMLKISPNPDAYSYDLENLEWPESDIIRAPLR